jgi:hypothetical protein
MQMLPNAAPKKPVDAWEEALSCEECGLALLGLLLSSPAWVHRRVESVSFLDHRTVRRRVSVDFTVPESAPRLSMDGSEFRIVPLTIMRRKSLVRFDLRDEHDATVPLLGLRQNQKVTLSVARAWARAVLGGRLPCDVADYLRKLVVGDQDTLLAAFNGARKGYASDELKQVLGDPRFAHLHNRLTDDFVLFATIDAERPRRVLKFRYDEPLTLRYRKSGYENGKYLSEGPPVRLWSPARILPELGWRPTTIRFPVPAAENTRSFHFEIDAPPGVEIASATILAGRPNSGCPSVDHVSGNLPTVDLHVVDVPRGSLSRAQVELHVVRHPWLTLAVFTAWATSAALFWSGERIGPTGASHDPAAAVTLFVTLAAAAAALMWRPSDHRMATRLLSTVGALASASALLLLVAAALFAFEGDHRLRVPLMTLSGAAAFMAVLVTVAWFRSGYFASRVVVSPWEQGRRVEYKTLRKQVTYETFTDATAAYGYDKPAIKVQSAEASYPDEFDFNDELLADMRALVTAEIARIRARRSRSAYDTRPTNGRSRHYRAADR